MLFLCECLTNAVIMCLSRQMLYQSASKNCCALKCLTKDLYYCKYFCIISSVVFTTVMRTWNVNKQRVCNLNNFGSQKVVRNKGHHRRKSLQDRYLVCNIPAMQPWGLVCKYMVYSVLREKALPCGRACTLGNTLSHDWHALFPCLILFIKHPSKQNSCLSTEILKPVRRRRKYWTLSRDKLSRESGNF